MVLVEISSDKRNQKTFEITIIEEISKIFRILLLIEIKPPELKTVIKKKKEVLDKLRKEQLHLVTSIADDSDYTALDISLLYVLLRNLCPDYTPTEVWVRIPQSHQCMIGDDIERLRIFRNVHFHSPTTEMPNSEFLEKRDSLVQVCRRMEYNIKHRSCEIEYTNGRQDIYKRVPNSLYPRGCLHLTKINIFGSRSVEEGEDTEIVLFDDCDTQTLNDISSVCWKKTKEGKTHTINTSNYKYDGSSLNKLIIRKTSREDEGIYQVEVIMYRDSISLRSNEFQLTVAGGNIQPNWTKDIFLGQGAFGKVYVCKDQKTAVKVTKIEGNSTFIQKRISDVQNEIDVLKKLEHQRIVKYLACQHDSEEISIFMEYLPEGSLKREINEGKRLTESTTRDYTRQVLEGLDFLHKKNVVHRDIKASNILRGEDGLKLADFGVSKIMEDISSGKLHSQVGTPNWQSPEIIRSEGHGRRTDIWSLGCTIVEMLTGNPPWHEYTTYQAIYKIGSKEDPEYILPEETSESCRRFLSLCFTQNRKERPYTWDMLKNEWITSS